MNKQNSTKQKCSLLFKKYYSLFILPAVILIFFIVKSVHYDGYEDWGFGMVVFFMFIVNAGIAIILSVLFVIYNEKKKKFNMTLGKGILFSVLTYFIGMGLMIFISVILAS